ncbi:hypothetical protein D9M68_686170 [compost metagenome]
MAHAHPAQTELDGQVRIDGVVHAHHHAQRRQALAPVLPHVTVAFFEGHDAAQRRAPDAGPVVALFQIGGQALKPGVLPGVESRGHTQMGKTLHHGSERFAQRCHRVKPGAAHKRHGQGPGLVIGLEVADRRTTREQVFKKMVHTSAVGADQTKPRDGHPAPNHDAEALAARRESISFTISPTDFGIATLESIEIPRRSSASNISSASISESTPRSASNASGTTASGAAPRRSWRNWRISSVDCMAYISWLAVLLDPDTR